MKTKTHAFTAKAIMADTPKWAKNMFRITFFLTKAVVAFIAGTNLIDESVKYEISLGLQSLDVIVFGLSKMFGVEKEEN